MAKGKLGTVAHRCCPNCGDDFVTDAPIQKYCKTRCKHAAAAKLRAERNVGKAERLCYRCGEPKAPMEFPGNTHTYCKPCYADYQRERIANETDEQREQRLAIKKRSYLRKPVEQRNADQRRWRMKLSPDVEARMLAAQGGGCAICQTTQPGGRGTWHIDHDHRCCPKGKSCGACVRGLLCTRCNTGGGQFDDDPRRLRAAADYFERARQPQLFIVA